MCRNGGFSTLMQQNAAGGSVHDNNLADISYLVIYRVSQKKVYNRILVVVAVGSLVNARLQGDGQLHEDSVHWLKIMLHTSA